MVFESGMAWILITEPRNILIPAAKGSFWGVRRALTSSDHHFLQSCAPILTLRQSIWSLFRGIRRPVIEFSLISSIRALHGPILTPFDPSQTGILRTVEWRWHFWQEWYIPLFLVCIPLLITAGIHSDYAPGAIPGKREHCLLL